MGNDNTTVNLVAPVKDISGVQTIKVKQSDGTVVTFSKNNAVLGRPQLRAPMISVDGTTLTIINPAANGVFVTDYAIYINGEQTYQTTNTTFKLTKTREKKTVTVKARGVSFMDSPFSNLVTYGGRAATRGAKKAAAQEAASSQEHIAMRTLGVAAPPIAGDGATPGLEDVSVLNSIAHVQPYEGVGTVYLKHTDADTYAAFKTVESDRNVTLNSLNQTFSPTGAYGGISSITVTAVSAAIDSDIQAQNIREGVDILGVTGTYAGARVSDAPIAITPSSSSQTVTIPTGYDGVSDVTVLAVQVDARYEPSGVTDNGVYYPTAGKYFDRFIVNIPEYNGSSTQSPNAP